MTVTSLNFSSEDREVATEGMIDKSREYTGKKHMSIHFEYDSRELPLIKSILKYLKRKTTPAIPGFWDFLK